MRKLLRACLALQLGGSSARAPSLSGNGRCDNPALSSQLTGTPGLPARPVAAGVPNA